MSLGEPPLEADATGALLDHPNAGNRAIRGSLLRSGAYVGGILATLISAPLLVRHLGIAGFGRYSLVNNTVGAFTMLVDAGLLTIAQREYVHRSGEDRKHTMAALVGLRLTLTISAVGAAIAFCAVSGYGTELVIGAVLAGTGSVVLATQHMTSTPLTVELRNGVTSAIDLCGQLANAGLVILLVVLGASLLPFLATGILLSSIALVVTKYLVRDKFPLMPRFDRRRWSELLRASLPYVAAAAITGLYFRLALIVLAQTSGDLETGEYATAFRLVEVVLGVPALLVSAAFPIIARAAHTDGERLRYQIGRIYEVALILGVWFVVGIMLIAPFALQFIAGDEGAGSVSVLRLQGPAVLATFFAVASAFPLLALRRHREVLIANVAGLVTGAVAVAILAPAAGADGTAVATVIAETVLAAVMTVYLLRSHTGTKLPLATMPFVLVFAGLALLLLLVPIHPIVRAVVGTLIYFGGLALFRRLPEETLVALGVRRIFPAK